MLKFTVCLCLHSFLFPGILKHQFQRPPLKQELLSPRLLRKTFLIAETENIEDYRTQIMSTFGKVLKYDSTKKVILMQSVKQEHSIYIKC